MNSELKLWSRPEMPKRFKEYNGMSVIELINREPQVVTWCVKYHNWVLSVDARDMLAEKQKVCPFSHTGTKKYSNKSRNFFR